MKYVRYLAAGALLIAVGLGLAALAPLVPARAADDLSSDELQLTLQPGTGERFLEVVNLVMGTETARSVGRDRYVVRQGRGGDRDDYAAFFAAAPYVKEVKPRPRIRPSEQVPKGRLHLIPQVPGAPETPAGAVPAGRDHVPGEILVKFKRGTSQAQIDQFILEQNTRVLGRIDLGEDRIFKLEVPEGVDVPDLASAFSQSPLVEYAEPNYKIGIPPMPGSPKAAKPDSPKPPMLPARPGALTIATDDLVGATVFVTFRPGVREPLPELVELVFGVERMEEDNGRVRYSLPKGTGALTAVRLFKLCPYVMGAEPSFGR